MTLEAALERYPREVLVRAPTPLDPLPHLSADLDVDLYVKREDLTELALGGDKPRKLEYELARATAKNADVLVTCGSAQSNHARLTTAAARRLGLDCAVVLSRDPYEAVQGNLLAVRLMGADVHMVETQDHWDLEADALALCERLTHEGRTPHYIPVSGTTPHSCLGYIRGGLELAEQLRARDLDLDLDVIYLPFGTGGIFTALLLALRAKGVRARLVGISVNGDLVRCRQNLEHWWGALCGLLDWDPRSERGDFVLDASFVGREYGDPTEASLDAILLMARREGVLLDPVYSGKVFAALLAHHADSRVVRGTRTLFLHSGGVPALFAYHDVIERHLRRRGLIRRERHANGLSMAEENCGR